MPMGGRKSFFAATPANEPWTDDHDGWTRSTFAFSAVIVYTFPMWNLPARSRDTGYCLTRPPLDVNTLLGPLLETQGETDGGARASIGWAFHPSAEPGP